MAAFGGDSRVVRGEGGGLVSYLATSRSRAECEVRSMDKICLLLWRASVLGAEPSQVSAVWWPHPRLMIHITLLHAAREVVI